MFFFHLKYKIKYSELSTKLYAYRHVYADLRTLFYVNIITILLFLCVLNEPLNAEVIQNIYIIFIFLIAIYSFVSSVGVSGDGFMTRRM
jgi:hypothetical protein